VAARLGTCLCCEVRPILVAYVMNLALVGVANAKHTPPPGTPQPEPTTTEEAQRAQAAGHDQASAAAESRAADADAVDETHERGLLDDADHPERSTAHQRAHTTTVTADVFPETHRTTVPEDPDPELSEDLALPPPEPEWRLRLGVGATVATAGGPVASLRLVQELEWMPHDVAPILFSLTGGEVLGEYIIGLGGARVGLYGIFCQDRVVTCTGAVALRLGVIGGTPGVAFDIGGDGDARFRFDGVELGIRVGFFVIQGVSFVDLTGMVGAAF